MYRIIFVRFHCGHCPNKSACLRVLMPSEVRYFTYESHFTVDILDDPCNLRSL